MMDTMGTGETKHTSRVDREVQRQAVDLFAPMECSVVDAVMGCIDRTQSRRRRIQSLVLGVSPIVAVAVVLVLYLGAGVAPWGASESAPKAFVASAPQAGGQRLGDAGEWDMKLTAASVSPEVAYTVDVRGDSPRRQLLAGWLMSDHVDAARQLGDVETGQSVVVELAPNEASELEAFLKLHQYVVQEQSGLARTAAWYWTGRSGAETGHVTIRIIS